MKTYQAIEDNGGGLHLFVWDATDKLIYQHSGYEYNPGQLSQDIAALKTGTTAGWEGNEIDEYPALYQEILDTEFGYEVVADHNGMYPDRMGAAAEIEFAAVPAVKIMIRKVPAELHRAFKAKCAIVGASQQQAIIDLMRRWAEEK